MQASMANKNSLQVKSVVSKNCREKKNILIKKKKEAYGVDVKVYRYSHAKKYLSKIPKRLN